MQAISETYGSLKWSLDTDTRMVRVELRSSDKTYTLREFLQRIYPLIDTLERMERIEREGHQPPSHDYPSPI